MAPSNGDSAPMARTHAPDSSTSRDARGRAAWHTDVLVVGAGIVGLSCAYYLLEAGRSVRVVDMGQPGSGCSAGNCGLITPSHAAPLNTSGTLRSAARALFDRHAPLYIKPLPSLTTLRWLVRFASHGNATHVRRSTAARAALLNSSRRLYDALVQENDLECDWAARGVLAVYRSAAAMRAAESGDVALAPFGVSSTAHVGDDVRQLEPALRDEVYGGRLYVMDAQVRPERLVAAMERRVRERGGVLEADCTVTRIACGSAAIEGVDTSRGRYTARNVVLAAGVWTRALAAQLDLALPIEPGKGYSITIETRNAGPRASPSNACILQERSVGVTPWTGGYRLGGTMEFAGFDATAKRSRLDAILRSAREYLRDVPTDLTHTQIWSGLRPMTPDELPFIGSTARHRNVVIAAGHGMMGVSMAPATGKLVAEIVAGVTPHLDPAPYRLDRG